MTLGALVACCVIDSAAPASGRQDGEDVMASAENEASAESEMSTIQKPEEGKKYRDPFEGFLYRVNENHRTKVWCVLREGCLYYYDRKPKCEYRPKGYINLRQARLKQEAAKEKWRSHHRANTNKKTFFSNLFTASTNDRSTFTLREGSIVVTFEIDTVQSLEAWTQEINAAIHGALHRSQEHRGGDAFDDNKFLDIVTPEKKKISSTTSTMPKMRGYLEKRAIGRSFLTTSAHSFQKRYFMLHAGLLRYYADAPGRADQLKGEVGLRGCGVQRDADFCKFTLVLPEGRYLKLKAPDPQSASLWADAIHETISRLNLSDAGAGTSSPQQDSGTKSSETLVNKAELGAEPTGRRRPIFGADFTADAPTNGTHPMVKVIDDTARSAIMKAMLSSRANGNTFLFYVPIVSDHDDAINNHHDSCQTQAAELLVSHFVEDPIYEAGDIIFWQDEPASSYCAIESGAVEMLHNGVKTSKLPVSVGCGLDELALMSNVRRHHTARCVARSRVWRLERQMYRSILGLFAAQEHGDRLDFLKAVPMLKSFSQATLTKLAACLKERIVSKKSIIFKQGDPGDAFFICKRGCVILLKSDQEIARCEEGDAFGERSLLNAEPRAATAKADQDTALYVLQKSVFLELLGPGVELMEIEERIRTLRSIDKLFSGLADKHLDAVARAMTEETVQQGDALCLKGEVGDAFYIVKSGAVQVLAASFLASSLNSSGQQQKKQRVVATLGPGAYFGETALLSDDGNTKREADVVASKNNTIILKLKRTDFESMLGSLGSLKEVLERESKRRSADLRSAVRSRFKGIVNTVTASRFVLTSSPKSSAAGSNTRSSIFFSNNEDDKNINDTNETDTSQQQQQRGKLANLRLGFRTPGVGSASFFDSLQDVAWPPYQDNPSTSVGSLHLVRSDETTCCYTLRVVRKGELLLRKHDILAERELLTHTNTGALSSQWLPSLRATASDRDFVYLLFDELPGGDLWSHLHDPGAGAYQLLGGDTKAARYYAAQALAGIEYLHARDVAHRAISPEAFLIAPDGRLVLFDLICAKPLPDGTRSNTLCGVNEYLAPELILAESHGLAVDLWAFGVLLFELVTRKSLFASKRRPSPAELYARIVHPEPIMARVWSATSYYGKLVAALLKSREQQRIGMRSAGFREIWDARFFKSVNKQQILQNTNPPWTPMSRTVAPLLADDAPSTLRWRCQTDTALDDSDIYHEDGGSPVVPLTYLSAF